MNDSKKPKWMYRMLFTIYIFNRASEEIKLEEKKSDITYLFVRLVQVTFTFISIIPLNIKKPF